MENSASHDDFRNGGERGQGEHRRERSRSRDRSEDARPAGTEEEFDYAEDNGDNGSEKRGRRTSEDQDGGSRDGGRGDNSSNLYVTNLSFQTTDESLKAAFERFGEISSVQIIREPVTRTSRGFGFVSFVNMDDAERAVTEMHGGDVDGRSIRVEKARRNQGYQKTPGVYLGPPQLSSRFPRDDRRGGADRRMDRGGYDRHPRGGGGYDRDFRGGDRGMGGGAYPPYAGPDRGGYGYRGPPMYDRPPPYRDERFMDVRADPRYDGYRGRDPPPGRFDRRGPPPPMPMGGGGGPPPYFDGGRPGGRMSPTDFRGGMPPPARGRSPPPGAFRGGPPGRY